MKLNIKFLLLSLTLITLSCSGDEDGDPAKPVVDVPTTKPVEDSFEPAADKLVKQGTFMGVGHSVTGTVKIYNTGSEKVLVLDPFDSQSGPDLKVYYSKDVSVSEYINLGALKSLAGKQSYSIPSSTDLSSFNYVHIWCQQFSVEFARAKLE